MKDNKRCPHCKETKPLSDFWLNRSTKDGYQNRCKICHAPSSNSTYIKMGARNRNLWVRYKLKKEDYDAILLGQDSKCAICKTDTAGKNPQGWNVDHDHKCCVGEKTCGNCIRGLLCPGCNTRLGILESASGRKWLENVRNYLIEHNSEVPEY
jgi:hypothetical protein